MRSDEVGCLLPAVCLLVLVAAVSSDKDNTNGGPKLRAPEDRCQGSVLSEAPCKRPLNIVGLFGRTGWNPAGAAFQYATEMAISDINNRDDVLRGYELIMEAGDTKCETAPAVNLLFRMLYNSSNTKVMVIGALTSHVSEVTAIVSQAWNLVQISYSAISPTLSDKDSYPWFFRTSVSESKMAPVLVHLLQHFNWSVISVAQQSFNMYTKTVEDITSELQRNNISVNATETFDSDVEMIIKKLQERDARIIYFAAYESMARKAACKAYKKGFYGSKIVWIFPGYYDHRWYERERDTNCSVKNILKVIDGYLTISVVHLSDNNDTINGWPPQEFHHRLLHHINASSWKNGGQPEEDLRGSKRAPLAYDAMWAAALALNGTLSDLIANGSKGLETFTYQRSDIGRLIYQNMRKVSFRGLSGNISFDDSGDRTSKFTVIQFQKDSNGNKMVEIGMYKDGVMKWNDSQVKWGASYLCVSRDRVIKMSSPNINNVILAGCVIVYADVFVEDVTASGCVSFCYVKWYLMIIGFSMAFGALLAKTWRVYKIMTGSIKVRARNLRDKNLFAVVGVFVLVNLVLMTLWSSIDPFTVVKTDDGVVTVKEAEDVREVREMLECTSGYKHYFYVIVMGAQIVFVLFGVFLAWQTRQVNIRELNDSRWISLCIYNLVLLGSLAAILKFLTRQSVHVTFVVESTIVCFGTTVTQCLVFVPKLLALRKKQEDENEQVEREGAKGTGFSPSSMCSYQRQQQQLPSIPSIHLSPPPSSYTDSVTPVEPCVPPVLLSAKPALPSAKPVLPSAKPVLVLPNLPCSKTKV
ncbi:hypothetical protein C0Q70_10524 [Pomacea canaliculata]|uniref:Gamma-aminobutyric acid type B receptor subunit 2 n=1 Tax=Pomacea canaliculata TaxID=400727 RepID=A0A2T7P3G3_POMCA|nr:hypothetical protein C0Q70_10524 [Pomacea canaliculata]